MEYDVDYFIKKFEAIPEELWFVGDYISQCGTKRCAAGWCNEHINIRNIESEKMAVVFEPLGRLVIANINDGKDERYQQPTPKQRILAALNDIKKMQEPVKQETTVIYKVVEVDKKVKALTKQEIILS